MRVLVTNDDGIRSPLLHLLARLSLPLGEVTVVAPDEQCSAMSHRITVRGDLTVKPVADFPVEGVRAYSVTGTPADCVKIALSHLTDERPDIVFSGINLGVNTGYDISYSGTIGAATEAVMEGIQAIAWSIAEGGNPDVIEGTFEEICKDLLAKPLPRGEMWNVNFPGCGMANYKGILHGRIPSQCKHYKDEYTRTDHGDDSFTLTCVSARNEQVDRESDTRVVLDGYISIGIHYSSVMFGRRYEDGAERKTV